MRARRSVVFLRRWTRIYPTIAAFVDVAVYRGVCDQHGVLRVRMLVSTD
jgi:hypothetical protein